MISNQEVSLIENSQLVGNEKNIFISLLKLAQIKFYRIKFNVIEKNHQKDIWIAHVCKTACHHHPF